MGSFNQTCLLTRSPITAGDDVVVFNGIRGPWEQKKDNAYAHDMLFGLPQRAKYDDYGGADDYADPKLYDLHERAWKEQNLYRSYMLNTGYSQQEVHIACHPESMTRVHDIEALFYPGEELDAFTVFEDNYDSVFLEKRGRAQSKARHVLESIGARIGAASLPTDKAQFQATCFNIIQDEVGPMLAWPLWSILSKGELFATRHLCMVRAEAYDYLLATVGSNTVSTYQVANSKRTFREYILETWARWEEKCKTVTTTHPLLREQALKQGLLSPMARPWNVADMPITSFFWNALDYNELMTEIGQERFVDAIVFHRGLDYLRSSLVAELGGGQHADWKLHAGVMRAVHRKAREDGPLRSEWYPYL